MLTNPRLWETNTNPILSAKSMQFTINLLGYYQTIKKKKKKVLACGTANLSRLAA